jgi:predicted amino acid-binding ACT domain protein
MLPYDKGALTVKIELFKMMLSDWQINFNNVGLDITDNTYTLQCLVHFMTVQEVPSRNASGARLCRQLVTVQPIQVEDV